jgi:hypothetical protein
LTDVDRGLCLESLELGPRKLPGSTALSLRQRRLRGGRSDGVDFIEINTGRWSFSVLPTRGMGLWRGQLPNGTAIGWRSPVRGPVHPAWVPLAEPGGLGWLDGFDELLCRCGLQSNGAPDFDSSGRLTYPLHGRIANSPAHKVEVSYDDQRQELALTGEVDEARFHFQKLRLKSTLRVREGEAGLRIVDEVINFSASAAAEVQMLYHVNFGQPLLDPGARVVAAAKNVAPRNEHAATAIDQWDSYGNEQPGFVEQVYFLDLHADAQGTTRVLLKNAHGLLGASLVFPVEQLPCFTVWKNTPPAADGYVTGLEPGTNFPNPRSFEGQQGRFVRLAAGAAARFELTLELHDGAPSVAAAEAAVVRLQSAPPQLHRTPQPAWSAPSGEA